MTHFFLVFFCLTGYFSQHAHATLSHWQCQRPNDHILSCKNFTDNQKLEALSIIQPRWDWKANVPQTFFETPSITFDVTFFNSEVFQLFSETYSWTTPYVNGKPIIRPSQKSGHSFTEVSYRFDPNSTETISPTFQVLNQFEAIHPEDVRVQMQAWMQTGEKRLLEEFVKVQANESAPRTNFSRSVGKAISENTNRIASAFFNFVLGQDETLEVDKTPSDLESNKNEAVQTVRVSEVQIDIGQMSLNSDLKDRILSPVPLEWTLLGKPVTDEETIDLYHGLSNFQPSELKNLNLLATILRSEGLFPRYEERYSKEQKAFQILLPYLREEAIIVADDLLTLESTLGERLRELEPYPVHFFPQRFRTEHA